MLLMPNYPVYISIMMFFFPKRRRRSPLPIKVVIQHIIMEIKAATVKSTFMYKTQ